MDTITVKADWWCPKHRLQKTKENLADELLTIAASHIRYDVREDAYGGYIVSAELCVCTGEPDEENESEKNPEDAGGR